MRLILALFVGGLLLLSACGSQNFTAQASTAKPSTGALVKSKNGILSLNIPTGWTFVDPNGSNKKELADKTGNAKLADVLIKSAAQAELAAIDLKMMGSGFADNVNVIDSGSGRIRSDKDLAEVFKQLEQQFPGQKLQHKNIRFPAGVALCYWGTVKQMGSENDLVGYAFEGKGRAYVITFSTKKGGASKILGLSESVMQTVKVK